MSRVNNDKNNEQEIQTPITILIMQNERTIQFWDIYHNENTTKEWILQPTKELIQEHLSNHIQPLLYIDDDDDDGNDSDVDDVVSPSSSSQVQGRPRPLRILEIGCGTSTLARDLFLHLTTTIATTEQEQPSQRRRRRRRRPVHVCATDVSDVCIRLNIQRDDSLLRKKHSNSKGKLESCCRPNADDNDNDNDTTDDVHNDDNDDDIFEYRVMNILQLNQNKQQQQREEFDEKNDEIDQSTTAIPMNYWDVIIDKGCLDTFLFRSKQRGENSVYTNLMNVVLDNIFRLLRSGNDVNDDDNGNCNDNDERDKSGEHGGMYIQITPRPRIRAVRDYAGFKSVQRHALPLNVLVEAETVGSNSGFNNGGGDGGGSIGNSGGGGVGGGTSNNNCTVVDDDVSSKPTVSPTELRVDDEDHNNAEQYDTNDGILIGEMMRKGQLIKKQQQQLQEQQGQELQEQEQQEGCNQADGSAGKTNDGVSDNRHDVGTNGGNNSNTQHDNNSNNNNNKTKKKKRQNNKKKNKVEKHYMYICHKNSAENYIVGVTSPFPTTYRQLPTDDAKCPHCNISFVEYRNGESVENGRGIVFWTREWKNHCIHCKMPHKIHYT